MKWEYLVTESDPIYAPRHHNEKGSEGWEMVSTHIDDKHWVTAYFKRPVSAFSENERERLRSISRDVWCSSASLNANEFADLMYERGVRVVND